MDPCYFETANLLSHSKILKSILQLLWSAASRDTGIFFFFFCLISAKFTLRDSRDRVIANKSSVTLKNSILCVDVKTYFFKFSANLSCWRMKITLNLGYKVISQNSISNNKLKLAIIKQISKAHPEAQFLYLKIIYIIHTLSSKNNWTYSKN